MIITRSTLTAAAATTAARWPLLLKGETLGQIYHNVGGKRRSDLHSDAVSAMLSRDCGRRVVHENSNTIEPQWINGSCTAVASVLPYYYCCQRIAIIGIVASLLADDDLIAARILGQRDDADAGSSVAASSDDRFLDHRNGLLHCCA